MAVPELSSGISTNFSTTYELFKPSNSEHAGSLRIPRCWHEVSRPSYSGTYFLRRRALQPKGLLPTRHRISEFPPHCARSLTCLRRSLGVSQSMWLIILSNQLLITVLVGHYPTNKLIKCRLIQWCIKLFRRSSGITQVSSCYSRPRVDTYIHYPSATKYCYFVRLAC